MQPAHGNIDATVSRQRVRRLFAVLDDVGHYAAGYASTRMLATAWDRISELLLQADDLAMQAAVADVDRQAVGSAAWWLAIRRVARAVDRPAFQPLSHRSSAPPRPGRSARSTWLGTPGVAPPLSTFDK